VFLLSFPSGTTLRPECPPKMLVGAKRGLWRHLKDDVGATNPTFVDTFFPSTATSLAASRRAVTP
jgi:hypothetical protein